MQLDYMNNANYCIVALAAAISCASLALSDGGIEMFDLPVGLSLVCWCHIIMLTTSIAVSVMHRYNVCLSVCPVVGRPCSSNTAALAVARIGSACGQHLLSEPYELDKLFSLVFYNRVLTVIAVWFYVCSVLSLLSSFSCISINRCFFVVIVVVSSQTDQ